METLKDNFLQISIIKGIKEILEAKHITKDIKLTYLGTLYKQTLDTLYDVELSTEQIIHLKSARKNWQRKRKKRKKGSASWRRRILPGKMKTFLSRKINALEIVFFVFLQGNNFVKAFNPAWGVEP